MNEQGATFDNLQPGSRYRVTLDDCCIGGYLEATFLRYEDDGDAALFDIARLSPAWGGFTFESLT